MVTPLISLDEISESQASKYATHNAALRQIEAVLIHAKDIRTSAPPGSPADGDVYICGTGSISGDWSTFAVDDIAWYNSGWYNLTPVEGMRLWVDDEDIEYHYDGSNWVAHVDPAEIRIKRLASVTAGMQTADGKTTVYTVPTGKKMIPTHVVIRNPTASLAGGTDYDLGDGANADTWKTTIDLSGMTATTDCIVISNDNAKFTVYDAADAFGIKPATGSTADADATVELFGYIYDA